MARSISLHEIVRHWRQAAALLVLIPAVYLCWLPDVAGLAKNNPKTTAYIQRYLRRAQSRHQKPYLFMQWVPLSEISPNLRRAVVLSEDDMFYAHHGIDWDAIREAIAYDLRKGKAARGASTITQQVARNLYLSPARNPLRKIKEMLIAKKLERALKKDRILELYLNIAEWGNGIYGVQAASRVYFGVDAKDLSPEQSVALAAALPSPGKLNPFKPERSWLAKRKDLLLGRMRTMGYIPAVIPSSLEGQQVFISSPPAEGSLETKPAEPSEWTPEDSAADDE